MSGKNSPTAVIVNAALLALIVVACQDHVNAAEVQYVGQGLHEQQLSVDIVERTEHLTVETQ